MKSIVREVAEAAVIEMANRPNDLTQVIEETIATSIDTCLNQLYKRLVPHTQVEDNGANALKALFDKFKDDIGIDETNS